MNREEAPLPFLQSTVSEVFEVSPRQSKWGRVERRSSSSSSSSKNSTK